MILFQNIDVYEPEYLGRKDVLTVYDKIVKIADAGTITADGLLSGAETVDGTGLVLTPGFVDAMFTCSAEAARAALPTAPRRRRWKA